MSSEQISPECVQCGAKVRIEPDLLRCSNCDRAQAVTDAEVLEAAQDYTGAPFPSKQALKKMRKALEGFLDIRKAKTV